MTVTSDYKVDDRSILLPYYKRLIVTPFVEMVPVTVHPNTLTHLGHLANLTGLLVFLAFRSSSGWPFFATALLVQLYNLLDNADGTHARRTGQCSPMGELLDHGLDTLNVQYTAYMTGLALGLPDQYWLAVVLLIGGAGSFTYWEQVSTGVFRVGMLNQVESLLVLSAAFAVSGVFGTQIWRTPLIGEFRPVDAMMLWVLSTLVFGMAQNFYRVLKAVGAASAPAILSLCFFCLALVAAAQAQVIALQLALVWGSAAHVCFGLRMLTARMQNAKATPDPWVGLSAMTVVGLLAAHFSSSMSPGGLHLPEGFASAVAVASTVFLGFGSITHANSGVRTIVAPEKLS